jgi:regulator of sigma E protease
MIFTILVAVFVLGVLIFVHELGHFLAAKLVGIQVLRFAIGLGKPIVAYKWGETEYALAAIPFGGYVKMAGDDPVESLEGEAPDQDDEPTDPSRHFDRKSVMARFLVIFAGPFMNFFLAAVLYMGIFYFKGAETYDTTVVDSINAELALPAMDRIAPGSRILAIDGKKPANWDDVQESCLHPISSSVELLLQQAGSSGSYTVSIPVPDDSTRSKLAYALNPLIEPRIGEVAPGKPAYRAGIQSGDLFVKIDNREIKTWREVTEIIHNSMEDTLAVTLQRNGEYVSLEVAPEKGRIPHAGDYKTVGMIGISPRLVRVKLPLLKSIVAGTRITFYNTGLIAKGLPHIFSELLTGGISFREARDAVGGPILIGQLAGEAARKGWLFSFMAFLSLNLALLNLLPIPVLDGGHLLFIFIEVIRFGKPLSIKQRMRMIQVGLFIVLALMVFVVVNDLRRVFGL